MKSFNNIARQCRVVRPEVGVVTDVGEADAGHLGGVHRVVKAKQELIDGLRPGATLYLNLTVSVPGNSPRVGSEDPFLPSVFETPPTSRGKLTSRI